MELVKITGDVLEVVDEMRDLPVKDKDGNPTGMKQQHRFTVVKVLVQNPDGITMVLCRGFDLPATFNPPRPGDKKWTCPYIQTMTNRKNAAPEVSFVVD